MKIDKIIYTEIKSNKVGSLVHWYSNPSERNINYFFNGIVVLNWVTKSPASKINKMSGWYMEKQQKK